MNIATIIVHVSDWNDELVPVSLLQLLQWKNALKLEHAGMTHSKSSVTAHVRKVLSAPKSYSRAELIQYLQSICEDAVEQYRQALK